MDIITRVDKLQSGAFKKYVFILQNYDKSRPPPLPFHNSVSLIFAQIGFRTKPVIHLNDLEYASYYSIAF